MKKLLLGALISFGFSLVVTSIIEYIVTLPKEINTRDIKNVTIKNNISNSINIKEKVVVKKTVSSANYLNAWKLSATIIGKTSFALVAKGRKSQVLKLKDSLEGYTVKKIFKDKVLFSTKTDDIWLYMKTYKIKLNNSVHKIMPRVGIITMRKAWFNSYVKSPEKLLENVNIMPDIQQGKFQGMKVTSLLEGSFLYRYGLRKGDVINGINGKKLLSIADGISAYQNITTSSKFSISVLRDNKIEELKYEIVK